MSFTPQFNALTLAMFGGSGGGGGSCTPVIPQTYNATSLYDYVNRWSMDTSAVDLDTVNDGVTGWFEFPSNTNPSAGTINWGATSVTYTSSPLGTAIVFNGTSSRVVESIGNWDWDPEFSIRIVFYANSLQSNRLFSNRVDNGRFNGVDCYMNSNGRLVFVCGNDSGIAATDRDVLSTPDFTYSATTWHTVIFSRSQDKMTIILDGVVVAHTDTLNFTNIGYGFGTRAVLGARYSSGSTYANFFSGQVDDFRIAERYIGEDTVFNDSSLTTRDPSTAARGAIASGQPVNSPTKVEGYDGTADGAYEFDGSTQYIALPNVLSLKPAVALTISAWVKVDDVSSPNCIFAGYNQRVTTNHVSGYILFVGNDGKVVFRIGDNGTTQGTGWDEARTGNGFITVGNWHHVVGVYTGSIIRIYVDGSLIDSTLFAAGVAYDTNFYPFIGVYEIDYLGTGKTAYFDGSIDDVRLYSRALTAGEIEYLSLTGIPPQPQDPIALYKCETLGGTDTITGRDLTVTGSASNSAGWEGNGIDFTDHTEYASLSTSVNAFDLQTFSISFALKRNSLTSQANIHFVVTNQYFENAPENRYNGWALSFNGAENFVYNEYDDYDQNDILNPAGYRAQLTALSDLIGVGQWVHVALTRTPSRIALYINGQLVSDEPLFVGVPQSIQPINYTANTQFTVNCTSFRDNGLIRGGPMSIDELRIYDRELSLSEVESIALYDCIGGLNNTPPSALHVYNLDSSGNDSGSGTALNLTAVGAISHTGSGGFDGGGFVNLLSNNWGYTNNGSNADFQVQEFSTTGWFRNATNMSSEALWGCHESSSGSNYGWYIRANSSGTLSFYECFGGSIRATTFRTTTNPFGDTTTWNFIAIVRTLSSVKIYLNGALVKDELYDSDLVYLGGEDFRIGHRRVNGLNTEYFDGALDDIRFYDDALTLGQIATLYSERT